MAGEMRAWSGLADLGPRPVVVSPHFDDAVLGCGQLLAATPGATVLTVFGGPPSAFPSPVTPWDALGGFADGDDVVAARRDEDAAAMAVLGVRAPVWLSFADHQYGESPAVGDVAAALDAALAELDPTAVLVPFGLANPDHVTTHDAGRLLVDRRPAWSWWCYVDAGYSHIPGLLAWRVAQLFRSGLWPTPARVPVDGGLDRKRAALACYRSQLPALAEDWGFDASLPDAAPEQVWRLAPPPPGWEGLSAAPS